MVKVSLFSLLGLLFFTACNVQNRREPLLAPLSISGKIDCPQHRLTSLRSEDYVITLYKDDGVPIRTTQPLANCQYTFENLEAGYNYSVGVKRTTPANTVTFNINQVENYLLNRPNVSDLSLFAGDVDKNGEVDATDVLHIRRFIMGTTPNLPGGMWRFLPSYLINGQNNFIPNITSPTNHLIASVNNYDLIMVQLGDMGLSVCN